MIERALKGRQKTINLKEKYIKKQVLLEIQLESILKNMKKYFANQMEI